MNASLRITTADIAKTLSVGLFGPSIGDLFAWDAARNGRHFSRWATAMEVLRIIGRDHSEPLSEVKGRLARRIEREEQKAANNHWSVDAHAVAALRQFADVVKQYEERG